MKMWDENLSMEYVAKDSVNIEEMRFQALFTFELECEYFPPDFALLERLYLFPESDGRAHLTKSTN